MLSPPLVTVYEYELGDLAQVTLPRGNVIGYDYDQAGRLQAIHRRPDASTDRERVFYGFDAAGNRTSELQQEWDAGASTWVTR